MFKKDLTAFQLVAKQGKFEGMTCEAFEDGKMQMIELQKVNRIFATTDPKRGGVYKVRDEKYQKFLIVQSKLLCGMVHLINLRNEKSI